MSRIRQFFAHLTASVTAPETADAHAILPPSAQALFDAMPVADRRHALDVVAHLRGAGHHDAELLVAALLHDAAKGERMRLWHRVAGVLMAAMTPRLLTRLASAESESWRYPFHLYLHHAELSAVAALEAGCSPRSAALICGAPDAADGGALRALRVADEAS